MIGPWGLDPIFEILNLLQAVVNERSAVLRIGLPYALELHPLLISVFVFLGNHNSDFLFVLADSFVFLALRAEKTHTARDREEKQLNRCW